MIWTVRLACVFGAALAAVLVCVSSASAAPKIQCAAPQFDFGTKEMGSKIAVSFTISNAGDQALTIASLSATWGGGGGTAPAISSKTIAPGEKATVTTTMVLFGLSGPITRSIRVASNDPATPRLDLEIVGTMVPSIAIEPASLAFGTVSVHDAKPQVITVTAPGEDKKFNIRAITFPRPNIFDFTFEPQPGGLSYKITIAPRKDALPQDINGQISIRTDNRSVGTVTVDVTGTLQGELDVSPLSINVTRRADGSGRAADITIFPDKAGTVFRIVSVETPAPAIKSEIAPASGGYRIKLSDIPASADLSGQFLLIKTDLDTMKQLRVAFTDINGGMANREWGPAVEGVQLHLEIRPSSPGRPMNGTLLVRNVSDKQSKVFTGAELMEARFIVIDSKGQPVELSDRGKAPLPGKGNATLVPPGGQRPFPVTITGYVNITAADSYTITAQISVSKLSGSGSAVVTSNPVNAQAGPAITPSAASTRRARGDANQ